MCVRHTLGQITLASFYGDDQSNDNAYAMLHSLLQQLMAQTTAVVMWGTFNIPADTLAPRLRTDSPELILIDVGATCYMRGSKPSHVDYWIIHRKLRPFVVEATSLGTSLATHRPVYLELALDAAPARVTTYRTTYPTCQTAVGPKNEASPCSWHRLNRNIIDFATRYCMKQDMAQAPWGDQATAEAIPQEISSHVERVGPSCCGVASNCEVK